QGASADPAALDDAVAAGLVQKAVQRTGSNVEGRDPDELLEVLSSRRGPERILDLMLRTGPYGDGFGADPSALSLPVLHSPRPLRFAAGGPRGGAARRRPEPVAAPRARGAPHAQREDRARARPRRR